MTTSPARAELSRRDVTSILKIVTDVELRTCDRSTRRQQLLEQLSRLIGADSGYYTWGRGHPDRSEVTPVAIVHFGFTPEEFMQLTQVLLTNEGKRWAQNPIADYLKLAPLATVSRSLLWSDETWYSSEFFQQQLRPLGWNEWITAVHYNSADTWYCLSFFRRIQKPRFDSREEQIVDVVMEGVSWLYPQVSEAIPAESFVGLSPRQRVVMLMLLDGMARKDIASSLGVTLHTINDHVKAVYQRFGINSATELAAKFLQSM